MKLYDIEIIELVRLSIVVAADSPREARRIAFEGPWEDQEDVGQVERRWVPRDAVAMEREPVE